MTEPVKRVRDARVAAGIVALCVASALFALIAVTVETKDPILQRDLQVLVWLHTHGNPVFSALLLAVSQLHSWAGVGAFSLLLAFVLWRRDKPSWIFTLALAMGGGMLLNLVLKMIFHRARPVWDDPLVVLTSNSFPSGHTAGATLFYGFLTVYVIAHVRELPWRVLMVVTAVTMVALVAFSRMYLGVHYLSDVLAAMSASTAWLVLCLGAVRLWLRRSRSS